jgi:DNA-binding MarR family transcriptional regulator
MPASDFMHPQQCLNANLRRAVRVAARLYQEVGGPTGLESTQFNLMAAINGFGTCTLGELAAWVGIDQTTATRSVALLRRRGLVSVTPGRTDRRVRALKLTDAGRGALAATLPRWRAAQSRVVKRLGRKRARQLLELLEGFSALDAPTRPGEP